MPYALGIDLGSGHTTAALCRNDHERWSEPEVLALDGLATTESVLHLTDEGTVEVGGRALRHVVSRPDRVTRGFVDRVGDEIPIVLGGRPYPAEVLIAALVGWIVDYAEATEGTPASQLVVTHPAGWGSHRRATLLGALREVSLPELTLLPRPVAAAESYAATERVEVGQEIAVHSLGAGRFESAVLRRGSFGFELRAHADSAEPAGGDLFDDLLAAHVLAELGTEVEPVALAKLRAACRSAKERLSTELAVTVPAPARSSRGTVMVNRTDLEELIRPAVEATVTSLRRTIQAAGTSTGSLRAVVLVGGCGRIPLVSELVSAGVRVRVAAAAEPELSVAQGAALAAARVAKPTVQAPALTHMPEQIQRSAVTHTDLMRLDDLPEAEVADIGPPPARPPVDIAPLEPPRRRLLRLGGRGGRQDDDFAEDDRPVSRPLADERPRRRPTDDDRPRRTRPADDDHIRRRPADDDYLAQLSADEEDLAPQRDAAESDVSVARPPRRRPTDEVDRESLPAHLDYDLRSPRSREADRRTAGSDVGLAMSPINDSDEPDFGPEPPRQRNSSGPLRRREPDTGGFDPGRRREPAFDLDAGPRPGALDDLGARPPRRDGEAARRRNAEWPAEDQHATPDAAPSRHEYRADSEVPPARRQHTGRRADTQARPEAEVPARGRADQPSRHEYRTDTEEPPARPQARQDHLAFPTEPDLPPARRDAGTSSGHHANPLPQRRKRATREADLPSARHEHATHHEADVPPTRHERTRHTETDPRRHGDPPSARHDLADLPPARHDRTTHHTETDPPPPQHDRAFDPPSARREHATHHEADVPPTRHTETDPRRHGDLPSARRERTPHHHTETDPPPPQHDRAFDLPSARRERATQHHIDADPPPRHHTRDADLPPARRERPSDRDADVAAARHERVARHEQRTHHADADLPPQRHAIHHDTDVPPARHERATHHTGAPTSRREQSTRHAEADLPPQRHAIHQDADLPSARRDADVSPSRHERVSRTDDRAFNESLSRSRHASHTDGEHRRRRDPG